MLYIVLFFVLHWYLSLFCQSFFHHRYAAHKQFTMSKFWEKFFHIQSWIFQGSSYLSPYAYAVLHRLHHAYADTEDDPHSPKYDDNLFKMMIRTRNIYVEIEKNKKTIEDKFLKGVPRWKSFDLFACSLTSRIIWSMIYVAIYWYFAPAWWVFVLIPIHIIMGPFHGVIINWFAHKYGYVNFKLNDTSKNLLPVDVLMLGESYHNNHHKYASRANFGVRWFEFDPIYPIILLFNKLGIIQMRKQPEVELKAAETAA